MKKAESQFYVAGKKVHSGGGFSGKGFKFDETEAAAVNERKKFQKAALGLQDSDDEDLENDIDQQIESMFATKRTVKEIKAPLGKHSNILLSMFTFCPYWLDTKNTFPFFITFL